MTAVEDRAGVDRAVLRRLVDATVDRLGADDQARVAQGGEPLEGSLREMFAAKALSDAITDVDRRRITAGQAPLSGSELAAYEAAAIAEMFAGGSALDGWLSRTGWSNLNANGSDMVFVTWADGRCEQVDGLWETDEEMRSYLQTIARRGSGTTEFRFDADAFFLSMELEDGSRLSGMWGGRGVRGVASRPLMCVRRHQLVEFTLDELCRRGSLSPPVRDLLRAAVPAEASIAITGERDAGKTTLMRSIAREIPLDERIVSLERTRELRLAESGHRNVCELESREANSEGRGGVALADLVELSLRLDRSRLLLGEILRPADVPSLLNAMSQGNEGSMCTLHARSAEHAFDRLISLCMQSPERLTAEAAGSVIASALDLVIHIGTDRTPNGGKRRFVSSIREVGGWDGHQVLSTEVCSPGPDGVAVPSNPFITPHLAASLDRVGYQHRIGPW